MTQPPLPTDHPEATGQTETPDAVLTRGPFAARANIRTSAHVSEAWGYIAAALIILICAALGAGFAQLVHRFLEATP